MNGFNSYIKKIDTENLRQICEKQGHLIEFKKNEFFLHEGEIYPYIGFIKKGIFKYSCKNKSENKSYNTGFAFTGEFVGEYPACLYGLASETDIQTLTQAIVYLCPAKQLFEHYKDEQEKLHATRSYAEQLFLQTYSRYLDNYRLTPEERYRQLLQRCPDILQALPLKEIASYLHITPVHMSRMRRKITFPKEKI